MSRKKQGIIKVDLLCSNERCYERYAELYDYKIQEIQKILELKLSQCEANSSYDKGMKHWMIDQDPGDEINIDTLDPIEGIPTQAWITLTQGTKEEQEKFKSQVIEKWRAEALEKDKRILGLTPFSNIFCSNCEAIVEYHWTIIYDRGTLEESDEQVLHVYRCPKCEKNEAIFEDGMRWSTPPEERCSFCLSLRKTTITNDRGNKTFLIHTCDRCKHTQVEKRNEDNEIISSSYNLIPKYGLP